MKKLPIGIQTFSQIREENYIYVDKTEMAVELINQYKYIFLSRPRRFGKSLFIDNLFSGNKELFQGLVAEKLHDWSKKYPVIRISFGIGQYRNAEDIRQSIHDQLFANERKFDLEDREIRLHSTRFAQLIRDCFSKYKDKVVILIDEYDKPILDNVDNLEMAHEAREELKALYTVMKESDELIRFALLTGVSKFAKVSVFSGLSNLRDISLEPRFATLCGYSHQELEAYFDDYLTGVNIDELKQWYDGYNFMGDNVYNPFDILLFFDSNNEFNSYWFETATPTFLIKLIKNSNFFIPKLSTFTTGEELLNSFNIENINPISILFQAGYLTIKNVRRVGTLKQYTLSYPNLEVASALNNALMEIFQISTEVKLNLQIEGYLALVEEDLEKFREAIFSLFAAIPYTNYNGEKLAVYEGFYSSVIYAWLASSHLPITMEDCTNKGCIDMTIILDNAIYILEFKVDQRGDSALQQIIERGYADKYRKLKRKIYMVGISFDSKERNINELVWQNEGFLE